ncbi:MAG: phosphoenolpyruvate carboxykinase (GTP) [Candidatus Brockarchaeota archaeon]|nr:phosphoenolpyruvate carboxykinase (GTP) [Candidatus Brockarchaeota archaeon]
MLQYLGTLKLRMSDEDYQKLAAIPVSRVHKFIAESAELCNPDRIFVCTDSKEDIAYIRHQAIESGEETPLAIPGHTYHFDGPQDQGRDREATKYLVPKGDYLDKALNQIDRDEGLAEIRSLLRNSMKGRTMIVRFLHLGPLNSVFSIPCMECTDSWYVAHSVDLLYRPAYEVFKRGDAPDDLFCVLHSVGKLNERMISAEPEKKRIYIDYIENIVYSVNTQYGGNSIGFKKLALRLAIRKADKEGWLAEHMMITGVYGPKGRKTYFAGAFPSACGKTSTAMLPGNTILADDIAYLRNIDGVCRAVNAEAGIFGIIKDVNPVDDPLIWEVLTKPGEVIFSNVLIKDGKPYWLGMGCELPKDGINYTGYWWEGKKDENGEEIPPMHKNARYTVSLKALKNCDPELDNPLGVELGGIIYGCRDARGYVPVQQSFDWEHGIIAYGAALETETTFAITEEEGKYEINIMSIQDFVSIPLGKYIRNNLEFGRRLKKKPLIFGVNYFLRDLKTGEFLNDRRDKQVWMKWMELRVHSDIGAVKSPTGWIPKYEDLKKLFYEIRGIEYTETDYVKQFTIRVRENIAKINRVEKFFKDNVPDAPRELFQVLEEQRERLISVQKEFGNYVSPRDLERDNF